MLFGDTCYFNFAVAKVIRMPILLFLVISGFITGAQALQLTSSQIDSYDKCLKAFNKSNESTMTFTVKPNKTVMLVAADTRYVYVYPSDGPAFKSPFTGLAWDNGAKIQLYFYTAGKEKKYQENMIWYEGNSARGAGFKDRTVYIRPVDNKNTLLLKNDKSAKLLKSIDRVQHVEELHLSVLELQPSQREAAQINDEPLLGTLRRMANKKDAEIQSQYSLREFDQSFTEPCKDLPLDAKSIIAALRAKIANKPSMTQEFVHPKASDKATDQQTEY